MQFAKGDLEAGVPQGSLLSPTLFNLFVNTAQSTREGKEYLRDS